MDRALPQGLDLEDRSPTVFGWLIALLGSGAGLFFWVMGAVDLMTGDGGLLLQLQLEGIWRTLFFAYPFVFVASLLVGAALAALRRDLESIGAVGTPLALTLLYYLALIYLRPVA